MVQPIALLEGIGGPELLFIGILALLMFGSKRLPELGRSFGRAMREFKKATSGVEENLREVLREDPTPSIRPAGKSAPARTKVEAEQAEPAGAKGQSLSYSDSVTDDFADDYADDSPSPTPAPTDPETHGTPAPKESSPSDSSGATDATKRSF